MSLYDPLIERDVDGIRTTLREFRAGHSSQELFLAVARFAVLAYSPSQHGKHAVLCCLAAHDLREELGDRFDDVLVECAIYAALARQPWSEPPILNPPAIEGDQPRGIDELRAAVRDRDRLRGERWLAANLDNEHLARDYFAAASDDFDDGGHKLIVATAAWRLASILGDKGRFAALRIGIWEMVAYGGHRYAERGEAVDFQPLLDRLIDFAVAEQGAIIAMHPLFLLDAACEAAMIVDEFGIASRVRDYLTLQVEQQGTERGHAAARHAALARANRADAYPLGRDCGACLIAYAVAARFRERFPGIDVSPMLGAARENLETGESMEEWS